MFNILKTFTPTKFDFWGLTYIFQYVLSSMNICKSNFKSQSTHTYVNSVFGMTTVKMFPVHNAVGEDYRHPHLSH